MPFVLRYPPDTIDRLSVTCYLFVLQFPELISQRAGSLGQIDGHKPRTLRSTWIYPRQSLDSLIWILTFTSDFFVSVWGCCLFTLLLVRTTFFFIHFFLKLCICFDNQLTCTY